MMQVSDDLSSPAGVKTQFALWGYAITGDITERSALIAEQRHGHQVLHYPQAWDHRPGWLLGRMVAHGDEPYRRVKDWAALPWVGEHSLRGHIPWPGL
jgi:hypothetical protein